MKGTRNAALHREDGRAGECGLADTDLQRKRRTFVREDGGKPGSYVVVRRALLFCRARRLCLRILDKIILVSGDVHIGLFIGIGHDGAADDARADALFGRILFGDAHLRDRPIGQKTEGDVYRRKDGRLVEVSHRHHLVAIVIGRRLRIEGEGKAVRIPFLHDITKGEDGILPKNIVRKFRRPQAVAGNIIFAGKDLRGIAVRPLRLRAVPVIFIARSCRADDRPVLADKALQRLGGSEG